MPTLLQIRRRFGALPTTCYKQMGLRAVRDAIALQGRNPERIAELHARAWRDLQYGEAAR
jgi:hypothetical protein